MRALRRSTITLGLLGLGLACVPAMADPMKPLIAVAPAGASAPVEAGAPGAAHGPGPSRLSATRTDATGRWEALLGTRWLQRGESVDGARVLEIDANRVLLLRDGRRETLFLLPPLLPVSQRAPAAATAQPASAAPF